MENRTLEKLGTSLSVLLLLFCSGLLAQLQLPQPNVEVIEGKMVVLGVIYTGNEDLSNAAIIWNYLADEPQMIISYMNSAVTRGARFKDRVDFVNRMPHNTLSIYINNTVESDSGRYMCQVVLPGNPASPKEVTLNVKVPPVPPVCMLQGNPTLKANVTLACHSSAGKPVPKYKWIKTSPSSEIYFSPMLNETAGTLNLNNLSTNMSGKYECTASNSAGESKCYINLEVITMSNAGVIAGATVGALLGLLIIIVFIVFFWRKRKDTEEDLANDIKEDAQAPKRVSWAKSAGSDIVSKNGTLSSVRSSPQPQDTLNHYHHQYKVRQPTSETSSIITTTASTGYRPRPTGLSSTPEHTLPGYNTEAMVPHAPPTATSSNGGSLPRTETVQDSYTRLAPPPSGLSAANLSRMAGVPIMVPAQNQAGSLV